MTVVKEYRQANRLTQKEMAERLGVSQPFIYQVESGRREISTEMMRKLNALDPQAFPLPKWICPDCQEEAA